MKSLNPYLNFNGKTEEAFIFYRSVFGGDLASLQRFKDIPGRENIPADVANQIMHIELPIGKVGILMGSDSPESMVGRKINMGNNINLIIEAESEAEAKMLFDKLSAGGKVDQPLQKTFWGAMYASFSDKYGVLWMINYTFPKLP
jgi:PhnB protein